MEKSLEIINMKFSFIVKKIMNLQKEIVEIICKKCQLFRDENKYIICFTESENL
jgi:hypothetical protein